MDRKRFIGNAEGIRVWQDGKWVRPTLSKRADDLKDASAKPVSSAEDGRSSDSGNASDREPSGRCIKADERSRIERLRIRATERTTPPMPEGWKDSPMTPEEEAIADELQKEIVAAGGFEAWERLQEQATAASQLVVEDGEVHLIDPEPPQCVGIIARRRRRKFTFPIRRKGRWRNINHVEDQRVAEEWATGQYRSYAAFAAALGDGYTAKTAANAVRRHRRELNRCAAEKAARETKKLPRNPEILKAAKHVQQQRERAHRDGMLAPPLIETLLEFTIGDGPKAESLRRALQPNRYGWLLNPSADN